MTLRETFGANVRHYRQARNLKQHHLAEAIDKTDGTVSKIERGESAPSFDTIEQIAAALDELRAICDEVALTEQLLKDAGVTDLEGSFSLTRPTTGFGRVER